jgi:hypothetical protein
LSFLAILGLRSCGHVHEQAWDLAEKVPVSAVVVSCFSSVEHGKILREWRSSSVSNQTGLAHIDPWWNDPKNSKKNHYKIILSTAAQAPRKTCCKIDRTVMNILFYFSNLPGKAGSHHLVSSLLFSLWPPKWPDAQDPGENDAGGDQSYCCYHSQRHCRLPFQHEFGFSSPCSTASSVFIL